MRMTLRQIYYRLVAKLIIPNTMNQYKALSKLLVKARENGDVDYREIEDRARTTIGGDYGWESPKAYFNYHLSDFQDSWMGYSMKMWETQQKYVEVWVEKDALSRVVSDVARKFNVRTCPSKGYSSFTYIMDAVQRLNLYVDKDVLILYAGDYDPSGLDITRDLKERMLKYGASVTVERIALSLDQINEYQLPPMPAKKSDPRYAKFVADTGGADAVELDALEPPVLQEIVRNAINSHIDQDEWHNRILKTEEGKQKLKEAFDSIIINTDLVDEEFEDED